MYNPEDLHGWYTDILTLKRTIKKQKQEIEDLKLTIIALKIEQRFLLKHVRQSTQGGVKNLK